MARFREDIFQTPRVEQKARYVLSVSGNRSADSKTLKTPCERNPVARYQKMQLHGEQVVLEQKKVTYIILPYLHDRSTDFCVHYLPSGGHYFCS